MMNKEQNESVQSIISELIDVFDEYVVCMSFASQGIREQGNKLSAGRFDGDHRTWIGSNLDSNPKFHARVKTLECIDKCKNNGEFSNEIRKSLLCTMYSLWDELYRHRIAKVSGIEAKKIICPLMGDLRKLRHCIIHHKSIVPDSGMSFEVLDWEFPSRKLEITYEHFLDFNDAVRGNRMRIQAEMLSPELENIYNQMTRKERQQFDDFYKIKGNKENNVEWPGLKKVLNRIKQAKHS
ncbi:hypothetical protein ACTIQ8_004560 [Vibrio parahaemolyticus]